MNQFRLIILLVIAFGVIVLLQNAKNIKVKSESDGKATTQMAENVTSTDIPSITPTGSSIKESFPSSTLSPTSTSSPSQSQSATAYIYPGATIESNSGNTINLKSTDNTDTITDWYKSVIQKKSMNVNTFIKANSNGNVNNVLAANNGSESIKVTITKSNGDTTANIIVEQH